MNYSFDGAISLPKGTVSLLKYVKGNESATVMTSLFQKAFDDAVSQNFHLHIPAGKYLLNGKITLKGNVYVTGDGMDFTEIYTTTTGHQLFGNAKTDNFDYFVMKDITLRGTWSSNNSLGNDNDRLLSIWKYKYVKFENVRGADSRQMGITAGLCDWVHVEGCELERIARDGFNMTSSKGGIFSHNRIRWTGDDSIAIHQQKADGASYIPQGWTITDNTIEDAYGIKTLGAKKVTISDNILRRTKGYGVFITYDDTVGFEEGSIDVSDVIVSHNQITDVFNANIFGLGSVNVGIHIDSFWSVGETGKTERDLILAGEDYNAYWDSYTDVSAKTGGHRIMVFDNNISRTLPDAVTYSVWGLGQVYAPSGFFNPEMNHNRTGSAIRIGNVTDIGVINNNMYSWQYGIHSVKTLPGGFADIKDNKFIRIEKFGIVVDSLADKTLSQNWNVINNYFDIDPFFESTVRTVTKDGTWQNNNFDPACLQIEGTKGWVFEGNTFRNACKVLHTSAGASYTMGANYYRCDPSSAAGLRQTQGLENGILIQEKSNPQNTDFGTVTSQQGKAFSSMPNSGYYAAGQFVRNISGTKDQNSGQVIFGWYRLASGSNHVLNTDWLAIYMNWNANEFNTSVKNFGAVGNGTTDDRSALNSALSSTRRIYLPKGYYRIASNITIPANCTLIFDDGALLAPDSGITITLNCKITAGMNPIFGGKGSYAGKPLVDALYPEWFGAGHNPAYQVNIEAGTKALTTTGVSEFQNGQYLWSTNIVDPTVSAPTNVAATPLVTGTTSYEYTVVAVESNAAQSTPTTVSISNGPLKVTSTNPITISWDAVTSAAAYYIYGRRPALPNPDTAPSVAQSTDGTSTLVAGTYYISYTWKNEIGETLVSPATQFAFLAGNKLDITIPSLPAGATSACIYIWTAAGSTTYRQGEITGTTYSQTTPLKTGTSDFNAVPIQKGTYKNPTANTTGPRRIIRLKAGTTSWTDIGQPVRNGTPAKPTASSKGVFSTRIISGQGTTNLTVEDAPPVRVNGFLDRDDTIPFQKCFAMAGTSLAVVLNGQYLIKDTVNVSTNYLKGSNNANITFRPYVVWDQKPGLNMTGATTASDFTVSTGDEIPTLNDASWLSGPLLLEQRYECTQDGFAAILSSGSHSTFTNITTSQCKFGFISDTDQGHQVFYDCNFGGVFGFYMRKNNGDYKMSGGNITGLLAGVLFGVISAGGHNGGFPCDMERMHMGFSPFSFLQLIDDKPAYDSTITVIGIGGVHQRVNHERCGEALAWFLPKSIVSDWSVTTNFGFNFSSNNYTFVNGAPSRTGWLFALPDEVIPEDQRQAWAIKFGQLGSGINIPYGKIWGSGSPGMQGTVYIEKLAAQETGNNLEGLNIELGTIVNREWTARNSLSINDLYNERQWKSISPVSQGNLLKNPEVVANWTITSGTMEIVSDLSTLPVAMPADMIAELGLNPVVLKYTATDTFASARLDFSTMNYVAKNFPINLSMWITVDSSTNQGVNARIGYNSGALYSQVLYYNNSQWSKVLKKGVQPPSPSTNTFQRIEIIPPAIGVDMYIAGVMLNEDIDIAPYTPSKFLTAENGLEIIPRTSGAASELYLYSADGTRYKVVVANGGASLTIVEA